MINGNKEKDRILIIEMWFMVRVCWCFFIKVFCFVLLYCFLGFLVYDDKSGCGGGGDDSDDYNDVEVEENIDDDNDNDDNIIIVSRISLYLLCFLLLSVKIIFYVILFYVCYFIY